MEASDSDANRVHFACGHTHDALIALILLRAPNIRSAMREAEEMASRALDAFIENTMESLKRGAEVITSGGIIGKVDRVFEDDRIELVISEGVKVQIIRNTIQGHLKKETKK